jgi:hypothetical protein
MAERSEPSKLRSALIVLLAGGGLALTLLRMPGWMITETQAQVESSEVRVSRSGAFKVRYSSELQPPVINRIHNAVLHLATRDGEAVAEARISISGGMPEHNHGLPTQPEVTRYLGGGRYLIEGLRFHMQGAWELLITIDANGKQDTVVIPLQL